MGADADPPRAFHRLHPTPLFAKAGQIMGLTLKDGNGAGYFNVLPPGSNGAPGGNEWTPASRARIAGIAAFAAA